jgi:hypothetical protein
MEGRYRVGIDYIRSLAIQCHALDGEFDRLFNSSKTIFGSSCRITDSYNQLLHTNLLNLAISIRTALAQEQEYKSERVEISACCVFETGAPRENSSITMKDLCDKIIHAEDIFKPIEPGVIGACCRLKGYHKKEPWVIGLGVSIFCELVLKSLEDIEDRRKGVSSIGDGA